MLKKLVQSPHESPRRKPLILPPTLKKLITTRRTCTNDWGRALTLKSSFDNNLSHRSLTHVAGHEMTAGICAVRSRRTQGHPHISSIRHTQLLHMGHAPQWAARSEIPTPPHTHFLSHACSCTRLDVITPTHPSLPTCHECLRRQGFPSPSPSLAQHLQPPLPPPPPRSRAWSCSSSFQSRRSGHPMMSGWLQGWARA